MMKVCSAVQQKGGVGKSNCIVHLAHAAAEQGLRVLVVDLDTQGNASYTLSPFNTADVTASALFNSDLNVDLIPSESIVLLAGDDQLVNVESMDMGQAGDTLLANLERLSSKFDVCFIDTAPAPGIRMAAALYVSGWVFSPIEVEVYSLLGVKKMLATIENMQQVNPELHYLGLVPSRYDARTPRQVQNLETLRADLPDMVAPVVIHARSSIGDALHYKIPVWQIKKTAARKATTEIRAFTTFILNSMGLK
ncbi:MAG: ParA family protein [Rheinheimera sp.]